MRFISSNILSYTDYPISINRVYKYHTLTLMTLTSDKAKNPLVSTYGGLTMSSRKYISSHKKSII
jgi:hypothetical protein